jgi:phosphinothricin acetyltransferase
VFMVATQTRVRPADVDDLGAVAEIFAYYVTTSVATFEETPPSVTQWRRRLDELAGSGLPFLVIEAGGEVPGFAFVSPWRPKPAYRHTVEDTVYLAPGWTGKGLGRRLLRALLGECEKGGIQQVIAVIADGGSPASVALHRSCGFTEAGRLTAVGSKHGRWIDTVLLQHDLAADGSNRRGRP